MNDAPSLEQLLADLRQLPSLPTAVQGLIRTLGDEQADLDELTTGITADQALAARVLRVANSPFYGVRQGVASIHDAIVVLGFRAVGNLVMAAALTGYFRPAPETGFDLEQFWRHGLHAALCARALARRQALDPEAAFSVGLLHDIGHLLLVSTRPDWHVRVEQWHRDAQVDWLQAERAVLGFDHSQSGAALAARWHFPASLVEAVAGHHQPTRGERPTLAELIQVADLLADRLAHPAPPSSPAAGELYQHLGLDEAGQLKLLTEAEMEYAAYSVLLSA